MISANMQPTAHMSTPTEYSGAPNSSSGERYHLQYIIQVQQHGMSQDSKNRMECCCCTVPGDHLRSHLLRGGVAARQTKIRQFHLTVPRK